MKLIDCKRNFNISIVYTKDNEHHFDRVITRLTEQMPSINY